MRVVYTNLVLATWLLLSAFLLGHTPLTATVTAVCAAIVVLATLASLGTPGVRYVIAIVAMVVAVFAILLPASGPAAINNLIVAGLLFIMALISPVHGKEHTDEHVAHPA